ncbi:Gfo/Idh/MocA family oxidoreductase [Lacticaseibacillus casei]|uniref:Gfo/Idh/MocA family protein n=1 Tax=Lacticaseibacillus casei TaxID=1582 RepID=UPI001107DC5B|nr:Gfo/Idh/MocA family oxidoreductase [Lacticaseibacillus casei]TLQ50566.1 Gfo/Idh/MocA family oxidoreductase [Lacticaseibacillus casei]
MIHYGLIGTNQATDDFVQAASVTNKWELGALYASNVDQADQYAKKYGTNQTFFDIADFFKNGNFDTVFIASPNGDHFSHIKQAIQADKHVIVQPPALTNPTEFAEVEQLLTDHPRALFFEGAYPIHMPNFKNIETAVEKMTMIQGATLVAMREQPEYDAILEGAQPEGFTLASCGGALQQKGVYAIYAALKLFGRPNSATYFATAVETGVDGTGVAFLQYDHFYVTLHFGFTTDSYMPTEVNGHHELIQVDDLTEMHLVQHYDAQKKVTPLMSADYTYHFTGELLAFTEVLEHSYTAENRKKYREWLQLAEDVNNVVYHLRQMVGIKFPTDTPQK